MIREIALVDFLRQLVNTRQTGYDYSMYRYDYYYVVNLISPKIGSRKEVVQVRGEYPYNLSEEKFFELIRQKFEELKNKYDLVRL